MGSKRDLGFKVAPNPIFNVCFGTVSFSCLVESHSILTMIMFLDYLILVSLDLTRHLNCAHNRTSNLVNTAGLFVSFELV